MESKKNWTAAFTETTRSIETVNFVETALVSGLRNNNDDSSNSEPDVILAPDYDKNDEASSIHRIQVSIFQAILQNHGPARAVQTLFTILMQMSYYDSLPLFDGSSLVEWENTRAVKIPNRKSGLKIIHTVVILHLCLFFLTSAMFLLWTRSTTLGNIWQAVSQTINNDTKPIFLVAATRTDSHIQRELKVSGRGEGGEMVNPYSIKTQRAEILDWRKESVE